MTSILDYYQTHSPITAPRQYTLLFDTIPQTIPAIASTIHGLLIHAATGGLYDTRFTTRQTDEILLRSVPQMLDRLLSINPAPLTVARPPDERLVGNCRDFATLFIAICRHHAIPARLRVGFATYFNSRYPNTDHWVAEYWNGTRWLLVDPEIDAEHLQAMPHQIDPLDMQLGADFYTAGQAWQLCRSGDMKSDQFGHNRFYKGLPSVMGNLMFDVAALNKREMIVFDHWYPEAQHKWTQVDEDSKKQLDALAAQTVHVDTQFDQLQTHFRASAWSQLIDTRLKLLGHIDSPSTQTDAAPALQTGPTKLQSYMQLPDLHTDVSFPIPNSPFPIPNSSPSSLGDIHIYGARQHNLKNISVTIPRHQFVVVTGVSGSGKSSLALDTLYAEGQRRYVESLSAYARQFLGQMEKPQVDQITGLSPAIAIEQKTVSKNPRSTVGTVTEILDYLRVLYARMGVPHCPSCGRNVQPQAPRQIAEQLQQLPDGSRIRLLAPVVRKRKGMHKQLLQRAIKDGYPRARVDGENVDLRDGLPELDKNKPHAIELVIDRLVMNEAIDLVRLIDSVETTLRAGEGVLIVDLGDDEIMLSEHHACPVCDLSFPKLAPNLFSFNSPFGMCAECNGLGVKLQVSAELIIANPHLSLLDGASPYYGELRKKQDSWALSTIRTIADHYGADISQPWRDLPESFRNALLYGSDGVKFQFKFDREDDNRWSGEINRDAKGVVYHINRLFRSTKSAGRRRWLSEFMSKQPCPSCHGERLCAEARSVTVGDRRLPELSGYSIQQVHSWITELQANLHGEQREIGEELLNEIGQRLRFLLNVGLHYLTLDRPAPTLSGGESQRIRLASQLGGGLVGVLYILDEPSIGLHARDHHALLETLLHLRNLGNTVVVIEHDAETMHSADYLIDLGPRAGVYGGDLIAAGTPAEVMADPNSLTGQYLSGAKRIAKQHVGCRSATGQLTLVGAELNNLKHVDATIPLGTFTCVTGVSGSGKSSLIIKTLYPALARQLHRAKTVAGKHERIDGIDQIDKVIHITQDPIGRTPRSNPATYVGLFDEIRKLFAQTPEAKARGYKAGRFSFNSKTGRCADCQGHGRKRVEMHFLADVWVRCHTCGGQRFNQATLEITYRGKTIADLLAMDVQESAEFLQHHKKSNRILQTLCDVGLDYVKLGQSALTLSGGEAQRIKLAKELSRPDTGRTLYILDEPTTGLHFDDIQRLLDVLHKLVDAGNTVVVIEHNLDVIASADHIIDVGLEGGDAGGYIVATGTPSELAQHPTSYTGAFLAQRITAAA